MLRGLFSDEDVISDVAYVCLQFMPEQQLRCSVWFGQRPNAALGAAFAWTSDFCQPSQPLLTDSAWGRLRRKMHKCVTVCH